MTYLGLTYVWHDDDVGYRYGVIIEAPSEEIAKDYALDLMQGGEAPFWPESFADHIQFDFGGISHAPDIGNNGLYYNFAYDTDVQKEALADALAEGLDEEDAQQKVWDEETGQYMLGVEPQEFRDFETKQEALDWLEREGLYPPHRVKEAVYPWEENPATKKLKARLLK